ncbi:hypothetical protein RV15_GL001949 [Enterococcus silesiacus]|uniref:Peptidase S8/S53 domain-containing protein n=2 Tax=Enterococcus silesiacus TaxID=332949 RepID=A0AA91JMZ8_9ENTE|nr:hypothetical protein RV15_GL001949 [Enterococcus silesiacus]
MVNYLEMKLKNVFYVLVSIFIIGFLYQYSRKSEESSLTKFDYQIFSKKHSNSEQLKNRMVKIGIIDGELADNHIAFSKMNSIIKKTIVPMNKKEDTIHATSVLGVISQSSYNGFKYGLADPKYLDVYNAGILSAGIAKPNDLLKAIEWCLENQVEIINISIAFNKFSEELLEVIKEGQKKNILFVISNGNFDTTKRDIPNIENVIFVGALDSNFKKSSMNSSNKANYYFPGTKIVAPSYGKNEYSEVEGTTYSAAIATGLLATKLQKDLKFEITFNDLKEYLKSIEVINK